MVIPRAPSTTGLASVTFDLPLLAKLASGVSSVSCGLTMVNTVLVVVCLRTIERMSGRAVRGSLRT